MTQSSRPCASLAVSAESLLGRLNTVERHNAPRQLFVSGDVSLLKNSTRVSIVGSRRASEIGLKRAHKLARELAEHGVVVVSGLARGVDTAAHEGAIAGGGRTVAVLGTPLTVAYPPENRKLQDRLMSEHLVVSQFPEGYPARPTNFPQRNRVMALISHATVIVEAGERSGAISQGWEAIRLGRSLFIMRSVAEANGLKWPGEMISYGASALSGTKDLLVALPREAEPAASLSF